MSALRSLTVVTILCVASLCPAWVEEEADFAKSALTSSTSRRLLEEDPDCFCFEIYDPVCGKDGETYGNSCFAGCAGVKVACEGECPCKPAPAPEGLLPKHSSRCLFCELGPCSCPEVLDPVCGVDGTTYDNSCLAGCADVKVACAGECPCKPSPSPCYCPAVELPVCGTDGKTYSNACVAACDDVEVACDYACPCEKA